MHLTTVFIASTLMLAGINAALPQTRHQALTARSLESDALSELDIRSLDYDSPTGLQRRAYFDDEIALSRRGLWKRESRKKKRIKAEEKARRKEEEKARRKAGKAGGQSDEPEAEEVTEGAAVSR